MSAKSFFNRYCLCIAVFFSGFVLRAQTATYFQQEVNYKIKVQLNDSLHSISASETITYLNNSAVTLDTLYFHLWPNAYKNGETALAKQLVASGETALTEAAEKERGYIDSLDFKVNGKKVKWFFHPQHIDICFLLLNEPLKPGETAQISTPFYVKIPSAKFSRLGHTGQAYFMTQWYPKPAVFDRAGWHAMPYLNQGEFYSEFGSFDVHITLPENYLLAATGDRVEAESENAFLAERVKETEAHLTNGTRSAFKMKFPASSSKLKTVHFRQYRVHDFAWFADKRFYVLKESFELPESKRQVDGWVFFTDKNFEFWKKALSYVKESTTFYSYHLGDYPYNQVTAVDGTIMAGGGMEYPNITVINDVGSDFSLDMVITHEVGHNWFYGILGSNEREHPFLDEGLNSFYEMRYVRAKYPRNKLGTFLQRDSLGLLRLNQHPLWKYHELSFLATQHLNSDQPMNLSSEAYTEKNYGSIVYSKTALAFDHLMNFISEQRFDEGMKTYYKDWRFKHPGPDDLFSSLSKSFGEDLSWFTDVFYTNRKRVDYKIKKVKQDKDGNWLIEVRRRRAEVPFVVQSVAKGLTTAEVWSNGKGRRITVGLPSSVKADQFVIDREGRLPELRRGNNTLRTRGLLKKVEPLQFNLLTALDDKTRTQINIVPAFGINDRNGLMAGLVFHNYSLYAKPVDIALAPLYSFGNGRLAGTGEVVFNIRPLNGPRRMALGIRIKSFSYDEGRLGDGSHRDLSYVRLSPFVLLDSPQKNTRSKTKHTVRYTSHLLFTDSTVWRQQSDGSPVLAIKNRFSFVNVLKYDFRNRRMKNPYAVHAELEHSASMARCTASLLYDLQITSEKSIQIRLFAGSLLAGSSAVRAYYALRASGYTGAQDYLFDGDFYDRFPPQGGFFQSQFLDRDGGLKVWTPYGQSQYWMAGVNLKSPRLRQFPIRLFADAVVCDGRALAKDKVLWDAGLNITLIRDYLEVYFPLIYNRDIKDALILNGFKWYQTMRFTLNIHNFEPAAILQSAFF